MDSCYKRSVPPSLSTIQTQNMQKTKSKIAHNFGRKWELVFAIIPFSIGIIYAFYTPLALKQWYIVGLIGSILWIFAFATNILNTSWNSTTSLYLNSRLAREAIEVVLVTLLMFTLGIVVAKFRFFLTNPFNKRPFYIRSGQIEGKITNVRLDKKFPFILQNKKNKISLLCKKSFLEEVKRLNLTTNDTIGSIVNIYPRR